jgi:AraC-like DNA-binding protein
LHRHPSRLRVRLIADSTVDRDGVTRLAGRVGCTVRQLERVLQTEVGAGPLALARAQRAQAARVLIETTDPAVRRRRVRRRVLQHPGSSTTPCAKSSRSHRPNCLVEGQSVL